MIPGAGRETLLWAYKTFQSLQLLALLCWEKTKALQNKKEKEEKKTL